MSLGIKRDVVELVDYDENWKVEAEKIIKKLKNILGKDAVDIQHVGSTSIVGMKAKQIIDIAVGMNNIDDVLKYVNDLENNGIHYKENSGGRDWQRFFICGDLENNITTHHIHVVKYGSKRWNDYIKFRDLLNSNPKYKKMYMKEKEKLEIEYKNDRKGYVKAKGEVVEKILSEEDIK